MSKWADLPHFILYEIICRLSFFDDVFIVGAVCKSWQSVVNSLEKPLLPPKCPWLMLAERERGNKERQIRSFFKLSDTKTYNFKLPELVGRKSYGASLGWLLTIGTDLQINLFHPLSKQLIALPPQPTFCCQYNGKVERMYLRKNFVSKCVLSRSPWNSITHEYDRDCIIMTIYGDKKLSAFTRPGYKAWIDIKSPTRCYDDIAFYKGKFYVVDCHGEVFVCRTDDDQKLEFKVIVPRPKVTKGTTQKYIVISSGALLLVSRMRGGLSYLGGDRNYEENEFNNEDSKDDTEDEDAFEEESEEEEEEEEGGGGGGGGGREGGKEEEYINDNAYLTIGFTVQKLKRCTQAGSKYRYKWVKVHSLGDQALFVGDNSSVSLSASSFNGCKANCIYFTDDHKLNYAYTLEGGGYDIGAFRMEDGKIDHPYPGESLSFFSTPLWYI